MAKINGKIELDAEGFKEIMASYVNIHGCIKDKQKAIELLCSTSKAWDFLSEELKRDPEVMMYYQPMGVEYRGVRTYEAIPMQGAEDFESWPVIKKKSWKHERGFTFFSVPALKDMGYSLNGYRDDHSYLIPESFVNNAPDGFDLNTYLQIRNELVTKRLDDDTASAISASYFDVETGEFAGAVLGTYVYDRTRLAEIVPKIMSANKVPSATYCHQS